MNKVLTVMIVIVAFAVGAGLGTAGSGGRNQTTTQTMSTILTVTNTQTISLVSTVTSLRAGAVLLNYTGSGFANSPPFTSTTPTVKITLNVAITSSDPSLGAASWYLYQISGTSSFDLGSVNGKSGSFDFYSYGLTPGSAYYVKVLSANANWNVVVTETK